MNIPVADPSRVFRDLKSSLIPAFEEVVTRGRYILGSEHDSFEQEFAAAVGVRHGVAVASGTDALALAMRGVGCTAGGELVTAANAGFYASAAARTIGLRVAYADVEPSALTLSAATIEPILTEKTQAVVVTHLYGLMAEIEPITELCRGRSVALIEDCAQAAGAKRGARWAGSFGDAAAFSFYPTKNLACMGDGGLVATNRDDVAQTVRALRQYGWTEKYSVTIDGGCNSRLDELQASILRIQLPRLDEFNQRRRSIVDRYRAALPERAGRVVHLDGDAFVGHLAVAQLHDRRGARQRLAAAGIDTAIHYPTPDHRQPVFGSSFNSLVLPVTEEAVTSVLSLPCFPGLADHEVDRVCGVLDAL